MPPGKLASQAGHAFLGAFQSADDTRRAAYCANGIGTKICLSVPTFKRLVDLHEQALAAGLPSVIIEDSGRNTTFGGVPTVSAVGIGPLTSDEAVFLRSISLHK